MNPWTKSAIDSLSATVRRITWEYGRLPEELINDIESLILEAQKEPHNREHTLELFRMGIQLRLEYPENSKDS